MALPRTRPPPPLAPEHLFLPSTLLATLPSTPSTHPAEGGGPREEAEWYAWGAQSGGAKVVFGVVDAKTLEDAQRKLAELVPVQRDDADAVGLLARLEKVEGSNGGAATTGWQLLPLTSPSSSAPNSSSIIPPSSYPLSSHMHFSPILYTPLKHLESLSLDPIRLGIQPVLSSSSSPTEVKTADSSGGERASGAATGTVESAIELINSFRSLQSPPTPPSTSSIVPSSIKPFILTFSTVIITLLSALLVVLSYEVPVVGSFALRTAFGRQLHTRTSQALSLAPTYASFRQELTPPFPSGSDSGRKAESSAHAAYIRFFNLVWLATNDLIIGYALSSFLAENQAYFSGVVGSVIQNEALSSLRNLLEYLNSWPMGVKLNDELAGVIVSGFLSLSRLWEDLLLHPLLLPSLPTFLRLLALSGNLGASSLLALSSDVLAVFALPYTLCYGVMALAFRWSGKGLGGLFNVFRGKKYNPLRQRAEPAAYPVDALLLGTILFVTLIFLFPTLLAFYLAFLSARLAILAAYTILDVGVQALNAFPLFVVMLRIKAPGRLPGGVQLDYCESKGCWSGGHLHLRNQPLSFGAVLSSLTRAENAGKPATMGGFLGRICTGRIV